MNLKIPPVVERIVKRISDWRGQTFLVGGAVIDAVQGREPKDWDLEAYGLSYEQLARTLSDFRPDHVGKSFGVLKISRDNYEIDISIPRKDSKRGTGHTGIVAQLDPNLTQLEAARRRDFTVNSMFFDLEKKVLSDPFGGLDDLKSGILRVTDKNTFVEDPLRALRGMQLLARKLKTVDPATMSLIQSMTDTFHELPKERIWGEFQKLILKAERPSLGFSFLRESGWLMHFPMLEALINCPQHPDWHPEGDVWTHSLLAIDAAAQIRHLIAEEQREAFMLGVFLHDLGKPATTITQEMIDSRSPYVKKIAEANNAAPEDMLLTAYGHDVAGVDPAGSFLSLMTDNVKLIKLTKAIVMLHMQPWSLHAGNAGKGAYARLQRKMQEAGGDLRLIGRVCQCDSCATGKTWGDRSLLSGSPNWEHKTSEKIMNYAEEFDNDASAVEPKVLGRDLIALGMKPGTQFGKILKDALDVQYADASLSKEEILAKILK